MAKNNLRSDARPANTASRLLGKKAIPPPAQNSFADVFALCAFAIRALRFLLLSFSPRRLLRCCQRPKISQRCPIQRRRAPPQRCIIDLIFSSKRSKLLRHNLLCPPPPLPQRRGV